MTSNVGARQLKDFGQGVGFGTAAKVAQADDNSIIENALKKTFAPEFLNRIDDVIVFNALEKHDIDLIIEIELKNYLRGRIRISIESIKQSIYFAERF
jgi:ATP-dependent Clp protease ATP-binding subunit ClpC